MRVLVVLCVVVALVAGCSDEEATPIDLSSSGAASTTAPTDDQQTDQPEPSSEPDESRPPTPHAIGETPQTRAYAEQQCHDDPDAEQGVIRIIDPATQRTVGEVIVDCAEVRATTD